MIYFATIVAYLVALVGVGMWRSRRVASQEDFAVAGRQLTTFVLFGTMMATWIGTGSIFGNAEKVYQVGVAALILPIGELIGIALLTLLAAKARRIAAITVQDILESRYNAAARVFGVITLVVAAVTIVSYQYRAAGAVLHLALPSLDPTAAVQIAAAFIIAYTALAGMFSVAYTDVVMGVTMLVGLLVAIPFFWSEAGGIEGLRRTLPAGHFEAFGPIGWKEALGLLLPPALLVLGDANMYQRFFSARTEAMARRATWWMLAGVAALELMILVTALFASSLQGRDLAVPGRVIAYAARDHLPVALGALVLTTIMAVIVSTAISYLLVPATSIVRDVVQRFLKPDIGERAMVWLSRATVVTLGAVAYGLSQLSDEFLKVALYAYTIYGTGITPALVGALVWPRATTAGALTSIAGGTGTTLFWELSGLAASTGVDTVLPAIGVSVTLFVGVSFLTPRR